jgi:putative ABC transport system permease protein
MGPQFVEGPREIVGIVGDVREELGFEPEPMMYVPTAQVTDGMTQLLNQRLPIAWAVRTVGAPLTVSAAVQSELRRASGGVKPSNVHSMEELRGSSTARARFNMLLLTIFGCAALLLAAIGIYGLMAYSVHQRTREIGVRLALGAGSPHVRNMIIAEGMVIAGVGIALGFAAALGLARLMASLLFGVVAHDLRVFAAVAALLSAVAFVGVWFPARRAARIDPVIALRAE